MLETRVRSGGIVTIVSALLNQARIPHAFSTRLGGVSQGPFASLNLGNPTDSPIRDSENHVQENNRRFLEAIDLADHQLCRVHQVHAADILEVDATAPHRDHRSDAMVTSTRQFALAVRTADCVPILAADRYGRTVAAIHAGWRGIVAGIIPLALERMRQRRVNVGDLIMAIGPCIGAEAFEVGEDVADAIARSVPACDSVVRRNGQRPHVDLVGAAAAQAIHFGLKSDQIDVGTWCTHRDEELFFSHRRDEGITGRMAAVIATRQP